jgi:hypothetical protein
MQALFAQSHDPIELFSSHLAWKIARDAYDLCKHSKITPSTSDASFICPCHDHKLIIQQTRIRLRKDRKM